MTEMFETFFIGQRVRVIKSGSGGKDGAFTASACRCLTRRRSCALCSGRGLSTGEPVPMSEIVFKVGDRVVCYGDGGRRAVIVSLGGSDGRRAERVDWAVCFEGDVGTADRVRSRDVELADIISRLGRIE